VLSFYGDLSDGNRRSCDARHTPSYAVVLNPPSARWRNGDAETGNRLVSWFKSRLGLQSFSSDMKKAAR